MLSCKTVPGTGEVARFPAETLGTHKCFHVFKVSREGVGDSTPLQLGFDEAVVNTPSSEKRSRGCT
jgi:hypothetical protein